MKTDAYTSVTDARSTVKESYVLLDVRVAPPQFVTVSGEGTPHEHYAERFASEKEAKKVKRAFERVPFNKEKYVVARMTEVHTYALTWEEPKP